MRSLSYLDRKIERLRKEVKSSVSILDIQEASMSKKMDHMRAVCEDLEAQYKKIHGELNYAQSVNKKLEEALEAAQEELRTAREITIPGLVECNQVLLHRWEAESKILAMRTAIVSPKESEL